MGVFSILDRSPGKQKLFKKIFLSKCLELKALQTLKISSKSEITFVHYGRVHVELSVNFLFWSLFISKSHSQKKQTIGFDKAEVALSNPIYHQFLEFQICLWVLATLFTIGHQSSELWGTYCTMKIFFSYIYSDTFSHGLHYFMSEILSPTD